MTTPEELHFGLLIGEEEAAREVSLVIDIDDLDAAIRESADRFDLHRAFGREAFDDKSGLEVFELEQRIPVTRW